MGAPWVVTVTTAGGHCCWVWVTTRRTTRVVAGRRTAVRRTTRFCAPACCVWTRCV